MKKALITLGLTALMAVSSPAFAGPMGPGCGMGMGPRMGMQGHYCNYRPAGCANIGFSTGGYYRPYYASPYYNNYEVNYPCCGYYTGCPARFYEPGVAVNLRIPIMF